MMIRVIVREYWSVRESASGGESQEEAGAATNKRL